MRRWKSLTLALLRAASLAFALLLLLAVPASATSLIQQAPAEKAPLSLGTKGATHATTSGASLIRTVAGLLIVVALIWGLAWVLKRVKGERGKRSAGSGLQSLAAIQLGAGRSVQLLRAGSDYLLVGVSEQAIHPLHRYSEEEARTAGLLELSPDNPLLQEARIEEAFPEGRGFVDRLRRWTVRR